MAQTATLVYDDTSGTSVLSDGIKVHWTEGRASYAVIEHPDGHIESVPVWKQHPVLERLERLDKLGSEVFRDMTADERVQWEMMRARHA